MPNDLPLGQTVQSALLYLADPNSSTIDFYDYAEYKQVGTIYSHDLPYGECVDAQGDVYVAGWYNGVYEFRPGSTKWFHVFPSYGGHTIGCSVDKQIDVAATEWNEPYGEICVWKHGKGDASCYTAPSPCSFTWASGYDDKGNLIVEGGGSWICALLAGAKSMMALSYNGTIDMPGGVMWDGKYITLTDQNYNYDHQTTIERATLSGTTLTYVDETILTDTCDGTYANVFAPFILGKKNTPANHEQGSVVTGSNASCSDTGLSFWHYPKGGNPYMRDAVGYNPAAAAVSLAK